MACACNKRKKMKYVWTGLNSAGEVITMEYGSEIEAKAKVLRKGGSYTAKVI